MIKAHVTEENKLKVFIGTVIFTLLFYTITNHYLFFKPNTLPFSSIDHQIPLIPEMIWIYVSMYFMMVVVFLQIKNLEVLNRAFYSFNVLQLMAFTVFFLYPVGYPRELFPLPNQMDAGTTFVFNFIRNSDPPYNCFPSLHVANCFLCSLFLLHEHRLKAAFAFFWTGVVIFSTMATKQHYLMDCVGGILFASVNYYLFFRFLQLEAPTLPENSLHQGVQSSQKS